MGKHNPETENDYSFEATDEGPVLVVNGERVLLNTFVNLIDGPIERFDVEVDCGDGCWFSLIPEDEDFGETVSVQIMPEVMDGD